MGRRKILIQRHYSFESGKKSTGRLPWTPEIGWLVPSPLSSKLTERLVIILERHRRTTFSPHLIHQLLFSSRSQHGSENQTHSNMGMDIYWYYLYWTDPSEKYITLSKWVWTAANQLFAYEVKIIQIYIGHIQITPPPSNRRRLQEMIYDREFNTSTAETLRFPAR